MENIQTAQQKGIGARLNEADTYYTMGLLPEALEVYEQILAEEKDIDQESRKRIESRINKIKSDMENQEIEGPDEDLGSDVAVIKKGPSGEENIQTVLDAAFALRELGLYEEAVQEYKKLFKYEYPSEKITSEMCRCLLKAKKPASVVKEINKILDTEIIDAGEKAKAKFKLGLEMEKINQLDLSMQLYNMALKLNPSDNRIKNRLYMLRQKSPAEKAAPQVDSSDRTQAPKERRREDRAAPRIPEFVFVEFELPIQKEGKKQYRLHVINYSRHGLGLLVTEKEEELLSIIKPGDKIKDVTFYARWAVIKVDVRVRHMSKLEKGPHQGKHIMGVESREIIESSKEL